MKHITTLTTITALTFLASACTDSTTISPHPQAPDQGDQRPYVEDAWKGPLPYYIDMGKEGNPCSEPSVRCVDAGLDSAFHPDMLIKDALNSQETDVALADANLRPDTSGIEECVEGRNVNSPAVNCALAVGLEGNQGYFAPGKIISLYSLSPNFRIPSDDYRTITICELEGSTAYKVQFLPGQGHVGGYEFTGETIDLRNGVQLAQAYTGRFDAPAALIQPALGIEETICYPQSFVKVGGCMIEVGNGGARARTWGGERYGNYFITAVAPDPQVWREGQAPDLPFCYTTIQEQQ
ncbi:hypothetical protein HYV86_00510 [Candidatus Woesearchaeota archaeon]|nr:hypothetical protein [Candidatus Woesearchaeota archaeon]